MQLIPCPNGKTLSSGYTMDLMEISAIQLKTLGIKSGFPGNGYVSYENELWNSYEHVCRPHKHLNRN